MTWRLAHNLAARVAAVLGCYPLMVVGEIGDPAHLAEESDHNPDSRGIEHAVDFMTYGNETIAVAILAWLLADPRDLQYVIHRGIIYDVRVGFIGRRYTGSNPHTDHVHVSGRHGNVGKNAETGTGYDTAAEAYLPPGSPCIPGGTVTETTAQTDLPLTWQVDETWRIEAIANMRDTYAGGTYAGKPVPFVAAMRALQSSLDELIARPAGTTGTLAVDGTLTLTLPTAG